MALSAVNNKCGYGFGNVARGSTGHKLALFCGTLFTLVRLGKKIKSHWKETREPTHNPDDDSGKKEAAALKEAFDRTVKDHEIEIQILRGENCRLREALKEKEVLYDEMIESIDTLKRRAIENFKGRNEEGGSHLPRNCCQEEEDHFLDILEQTINDPGTADFPNNSSLLQNSRRHNVYELVLSQRRQIEKLAKENGLLKREKLESERNENVINGLENEVLALAEEHRQMKEESERQIRDVTEKLRNLRCENTEKDVQIENIKTENIEQRERMMRSQKELSDLHGQNMEMKIQVDQLRKEKVEYEKTINRNENMKSEMEKQVNDLKEELANLEVKNMEKDQMIDQLRMEKLEQENVLCSFKRKVQHFVDESKNVKEETEKQMDDLKEKLVTLEDENKEKEQMVDQLRMEKLQLENAVCSFKRKCQNFVEENEKIKDEMDKQVDDLKQQLVDLKDENNEKDQVIEQLRMKKIKQEKMICSLERKVQDFVEETEKMKGKLEKQVDDLKGQLVNLEEENKEKDQITDQT
ncbi:interaptin-like [Macrobrachium rosenbergii]|uniref:interaptin-like n=1 Tax=Macrobrachium rosenbergii TaxID=79674 RepID=UPI0034D59FD9